VAISRETLQLLQTASDSFKPSVELPLGSLQPPESGYVVLPDGLKLVPGVPVRIGTTPWDYTVMHVSATALTVVMDRASMHSQEVPRRQVCISRNVIEQLSEPDAEKAFAQRAKEIEASNASSRLRSVRPYSIDIPVPDDFARIDAQTPLKVGTRCMACWARKWNLVTVVSLPDSGHVEIKWDGWSSLDTLPRDSLIIAKSTLEELTDQAESTAGTTGKPASSDSKEAKKYKLILQEVGEKRALVIKGVMKLTDLDLKTTTAVIADLPIELTKSLSKKEADDWKSKFELAGATVSIEPVE
jgi:ribosomal protein L7/L12